MKAVVALLGAIVMVALAVVVRNTVIAPSADQPSTPVAVVCVEELSSECTNLPGASVRIEAAGITADALTTATPPAIAVWVVPQPWPQLVDSVRAAAGLDPLFTDPATPVAQSPLAILARTERLQPLAQTCKVQPDALDWRCIGEYAGRPWASVGGAAEWGDVKPGIDNPPVQSIGLLVAGQALSQRVGRSDFGRDVFDDPAISEWFTRLARSVPATTVGTSPLDRMLAVPASYDFVGDTRAAVRSGFGAAADARRSAFTPIDGATKPGGTGTAGNPPQAVAVLVVAGLPNQRGARDRVARELRNDQRRRLLEQAQWTIVTGSPQIATNLPNGGTMQVIRERWVEALR